MLSLLEWLRKPHATDRSPLLEEGGSDRRYDAMGSVPPSEAVKSVRPADMCACCFYRAKAKVFVEARTEQNRVALDEAEAEALAEGIKLERLQRIWYSTLKQHDKAKPIGDGLSVS